MDEYYINFRWRIKWNFCKQNDALTQVFCMKGHKFMLSLFDTPYDRFDLLLITSNIINYDWASINMRFICNGKFMKCSRNNCTISWSFGVESIFYLYKPLGGYSYCFIDIRVTAKIYKHVYGEQYRNVNNLPVYVIREYEHGKYTNCLLHVRESPYISTFQIHKHVLKNISKPFNKLFLIHGNELIIDESRELMKILIEFLYYGHLNIYYHNLRGLFALAKKYEITTLMLACEQAIFYHINDNNFKDLLDFSLICRASNLYHNIILYILYFSSLNSVKRVYRTLPLRAIYDITVNRSVYADRSQCSLQFGITVFENHHR